MPAIPRPRVGFIGFGAHVRAVLLPAFLTLPVDGSYEARAGGYAGELAGIAAASERSAQEAAAAYHVPTYVGYEDLLARADVEAVVVAIPPAKLAAATVAALRAGKHVFCEASGVQTPEEVAAVRAALAAARDRTLMYGSCTRYAPVYRKLRDQLVASRGDDPTPRLLTIRYFIWNWFYYDLARFLLGEARAVAAQRLADHEVALLEFEGGDSGLVISSPVDNPSLPLEVVDVTGGQTWLSARNGWELVVHRQGGGLFTFDASQGAIWNPSSLPYGHLNPLYLRGYLAELDQFFRCIHTGEPSDSGLDDVEGTMLLRAAVARSIESGSRVVVR